jgi:hypothetical protein
MHPLDRLLGTVIHPEDLYFLHHVDRLPVKELCIEHYCSNNHVILNNISNIELFHIIDRGLRTLYHKILPLELQALTLKMDVGLVDNPTIRDISLLKRRERLD